MKKYRFAFQKSAYVIFALIILSAVVAIVFASLRLAGVGDFMSAYPATDVVTIVAFAVFLGLIGWDLFASYYAFEEDSFLAAQLFSRKRIAREALAKVVVDDPTGLVVLYYADPSAPDALLYIAVNIKRALAEDFLSDLRAFRSDLPVEHSPAPSSGEADDHGGEE